MFPQECCEREDIIGTFHDEYQFGMSQIIGCAYTEKVSDLRNAVCSLSPIAVDDDIRCDLCPVDKERAVRRYHDLLCLCQFLKDRFEFVDRAWMQMRFWFFKGDNRIFG